MPPKSITQTYIRKIWAVLVLGLGALWLFGGVFGVVEGHFSAWVLLLCGLVLMRVGYYLLKSHSS